jgi:tetratricopeptide (TPR) repeat protein
VLRGKEHFQRNSKPENVLAREHYLKAIELAPEYGLAYTWLGWTHFYDYELGWSDDPSKSSTLGLSSVRRAAELDPLDAWAQAGLAYSYTYSRQYDFAEMHIEKALKLNSNDADILALKGLTLTLLGRLADGIEALEMARLRNPFALDWYLWCLGVALYTSGKYERAIAAWREMPNTPTEVFACLAASYAQIGQLDDAQKCLAEFHQRSQKELANYPQEDREEWQRYWFQSFPYKNAEHLDHLLDGLRKAGLPV